MRAGRLALLLSGLATLATTVRAEIKLASKSAEIKLAAVHDTKPKPGEPPTIEVGALQFFDRFGAAINASTHVAELNSGGRFINTGKANLYIRACVTFLDADKNSI